MEEDGHSLNNHKKIYESKNDDKWDKKNKKQNFFWITVFSVEFTSLSC